MKKKSRTYIISLILVLFFVMIIVSGGTYAYWQWTSDSEKNKNVVFNTSGDISNYIRYDEGDSYFVGDFQPESAFCQSVNTTLSFYKTSDIQRVQIMASIYMDVNSIGDAIAESDSVYWLVTEGDNTIDCIDGLDSEEIINYGTFNGVVAEDVIPLVSDIEVETTVKEYTVWIWMDSNGENLSELSGNTVDTNIWTQFDQVGTKENGLGTPVLDGGMIPVTISNDGTVITVSDSDQNWYDYNNKKWANAILVDDDSRSAYKNTTGVTVDQSDILAYYVWIPRYKYKIWTTGVSAAGLEQTIDIVFESASDEMSLGTQVGEYRTHPAFWWDNNSDGSVDDGEMVSGIWVGKFETSANIDSACYTASSTANCVSSNISPRVLPNVSSLRYQTVSNQFQTSKKFSAMGNIYGLSNLSTNSHMMKNSEWGAVAYLSRSIYGINDEIRINNNNSFTTGCGASEENLLYASSECDISYNSESTPQSTTGNITGVFDMSGGSWEYVMGVLADDDGNPRSGYTSSENSGFNGLLYNNVAYTAGINFPVSKYYDLYTGTTELNSCNGGICYGHALSETAGWYEDYVDFAYSSYPWILRGGYYVDVQYAGAFLSSSRHGHAVSYYSWRSVLVIGFGE